MIARALLADAAWSGLIALVAVATLGTVAGALAVLHGDVAVADPRVWLWVVALAVPTTLPIALPAAGGGIAAALRSWDDDGTWIGLRASGIRGRQLVPAALVLGAALGLGALGAGWADPWARRAAKERLFEAQSAITLHAGTVTEVGGLSLAPERLEADGAHDVFLARGGAIGSADRVAVQDRALILEDGVIATAGEHPWTLSFGRWRAPLTADRRRVELSERSPGELMESIARTEADGRDASYERSVLYKRWLHPLAVAAFPAAILPLGVRRAPLVWLGMVAIAYLVAVRIGDQLATTIGPWGAAAAGPLWVATVGAIAWTTWRDR